MGTIAYVLIIVATTIGVGTDSGGSVQIHEVAPFTSQQACDVAGKKAVIGLAIEGQTPKNSPREFHGKVRVSYVCIEKK